MLGQIAVTGGTASEIAHSLESAIRDGRLPPGVQLPTIRALADELAVSPMTVASAYRELRLRGLVVAAGRRGTRVAARPPLPVPPRILIPPGARDLASGNPDPALLPSLDDALARIDTTPRLYVEQGKLPQLVEPAAAQFRSDDIAAPALAVVGGALDGIERVLQAHLRLGDSVAVEDPGFVRAYDLLRPLGLYLEPMAVDDEGPLPDQLEAALARGVRAVILTPRAQNPTGAALEPRRAGELRALLDAHEDVLVVEDDHAAGVAGASAYSVTSAARPKWVIVRSVSKTLGPDLRLAILAGDVETIGRVEGRQLLGAGWVSGILQQIVAAMWSDETTLRQLHRAEETYSARRSYLLTALRAHGIAAHGKSGLNVWVSVTEEATIAAALLERGWAVTAGERWRLNAQPGIRVTTATLEPREADRFAADLAVALARHTGTFPA